MPYRIRAAALVGVLFAFLLAAQPVIARVQAQAGFAAGPIERITTGTEGLGGGTYASLSRDGRFVAFESTAPDVLPGQVEDSWDVFLYDRQVRSSTRISTGAQGQPVYNPGTYTAPPAIASTGGQVAFMSSAANLVPNDTNGAPDVFLYDPNRGGVVLVSAALGGVSANGASYRPAISADGKFVAFISFASNLVTGDTNDSFDVFVRDIAAGTTRRVSVTTGGVQGTDSTEYPYSSIAISDDGRYVAFAYNELPIAGQNGVIGPRVYLHDRLTHATRAIATGRHPALSGSGRYLVFVTNEPLVSQDRNNSDDVYFTDTSLPGDVFERVSVSSAGAEAVLQDIYSSPDITDNGKFVVFAANGGLGGAGTAGVFHVYLRSRVSATTTLVSRTPAGLPANGDSDMPAVSGDGRGIAFSSYASDLVAGDTNQGSDVFVFDSTQYVVTAPPYVLRFPFIHK